VYELDEALQLPLDKQKRHSIEVVVDRLLIQKGKMDRPRVADSVETASRIGEGTVVVENRTTGSDVIFSEQFACPTCGLSLPELEPRLFSFNSPHGACPACTGLGTQLDVDPELVLPNPELSIHEGAIKPWAKRMGGSGWALWVLEAVARKHRFSLDLPAGKLPKAA
jgi:excinuclease ABC subunit A